MATMTRAERVRRADPHRHFLTHCAVMPAWHKAVILLAVLLAVGGVAGTLFARSGSDAQLHISATTSAPGGSKSGAASAANGKQSSSESVQSLGSLSRVCGPAMMIGICALVGFA